MDTDFTRDKVEAPAASRTVENLTRDIMKRGGISEGAAYAAALQIVELKATRALIERDLRKLNL